MGEKEKEWSKGRVLEEMKDLRIACYVRLGIAVVLILVGCGTFFSIGIGFFEMMRAAAYFGYTIHADYLSPFFLLFILLGPVPLFGSIWFLKGYLQKHK